MTTDQLHAEIMYQKSVAPFIQMEKAGVISTEDLRTVVAIMTKKYRPIIVHCIVSN